MSHLLKEGQEDQKKVFFLNLGALLRLFLNVDFTEERFLILQILHSLLVIRLSEGQRVVQEFIPALVDVFFTNISGQQSLREVVREGRYPRISFLEEKALIFTILIDNMSEDPREDTISQEIVGRNTAMIRVLIVTSSDGLLRKDGKFPEETVFSALKLLTWLSFCGKNDEPLIENEVVSHWVDILRGDLSLRTKGLVITGLCNLSRTIEIRRRIGQEPGIFKAIVDLLRSNSAPPSSFEGSGFAMVLFLLARGCLENQRLISAEFGGQTLPLLEECLMRAVGAEKEYLLKLFDCLSTEKMELRVKEGLLQACAENNVPEFKKLLMDGVDCFGIVRPSDGATLFHVVASHGESGYDLALTLVTHIGNITGLIPTSTADLALQNDSAGKLNRDLSKRDRAGNLAIHEAIRSKSYRFASLILTMGSPEVFCCRGADGRFVLHAALEPLSRTALYEEHWRGLIGVLPSIIEKTIKTTLELKDNNGKTPLWLALEYGNHLIVECLIRQNVSIKETFEFLSGLSRSKQKELLKVRNLMGFSLAHFLILLDRKIGKELWDELVQCLGPKVFLEVVNHTKDSKGKTPRDWLTEKGLLSWLPALPDAATDVASAPASVGASSNSFAKTSVEGVKTNDLHKDSLEEERIQREKTLTVERAQLEAFWQELKSQKEFWVDHKTNSQAVLNSVIERLESFKSLLSTEVGMGFNWQAHLNFDDEAAKAKFLAALEVFAQRVKGVIELHGATNGGLSSDQTKKSGGRAAPKAPTKALSKDELRKQREALSQEKIAILNQLFSKESVDFVNPIRAAIDSIKVDGDKVGKVGKVEGAKVSSAAPSGTKGSSISPVLKSETSSLSTVSGSLSGSSTSSSRRSSSSVEEAGEDFSGSVVSAGAGHSISRHEDVNAQDVSGSGDSGKSSNVVSNLSTRSLGGDLSTLFYGPSLSAMGGAGATAGAGSAASFSSRVLTETRHGVGFSLVSLGLLLAKGFEVSKETYAMAWNRRVDIFRNSSRTSDLEGLRESLIEFYSKRYEHSLWAAAWVDRGGARLRNSLVHAVLLPERAAISTIHKMNRDEISATGLTDEVSEYLGYVGIEPSLTEGKVMGGERGYEGGVENLQGAFYDRISWLSAFNFFSKGTDKSAVDQQNALALLISEIAEIGDQLVILSTDEVFLKRTPALDEALRLRNRMWHFAEGCSVESQSGEDLFSPKLLKRLSDELQREYSAILAKDLEPAF